MNTNSNEFDIEKLPVTITYVGQVKRGDWDCDMWRVQFYNVLPNSGNGHAKLLWTTEYYTGLGHREPPKSKSTPFNSAPQGKPVKPTIASVLHSIISDADGALQNFNDWCADFGYDDDSIKAFKIYQECMMVAEKLREVFDHKTREAIREAVKGM